MSDIVNKVTTTNAGELAYIVDKENQYGRNFVKINISGHVLLNQCCTLFTQNKYQIKGSILHICFIKRICVTICGLSIYMVYTEGILFPSIHWNVTFKGYFVFGCIAALLLTESIISFGFDTIQLHVWSRLANPSSSTSIDPQYSAHCYGILANVSVNHKDTQLVLNRVSNDKFVVLGVRGGEYSALLELVDN